MTCFIRHRGRKNRKVRKIVNMAWKEFRKLGMEEKDIIERVNDFTCKKCGKGKILTIVELSNGFTDEQVISYKCSHCDFFTTNYLSLFD